MIAVQGKRRALAALGTLLICAATVIAHDAPRATNPEEPFLAANRIAMQAMMSGMDVEPRGDVDKDFVAMMIPHHQGAIDMARAELLYGHNEQLRRIAQEIIVGQESEIAAMKMAAAAQ